MTDSPDLLRETVPTIAFAGDETYFPGLVVALASTLKWLPSDSAVEVVVFDEGLSSRSRRELRSLVSRAAADAWLRFVPGFGESGGAVPTPHHLTPATYARLLLPDVLESEGVAVYLDADMLIRGSIEPLLRVELGDAPIAACVDGGVSSLAAGLDYSNGAYRKDAGSAYINAGLLVLNLGKWRSHELAKRVLAYTHEWEAQVRYGDQDGINAVCAPEARILSGGWNYQVRVEAQGATLLGGLRLSGVTVVHFNGPKPWASLGWLGGGSVALRTWAEWWWFAVASSALPLGFRARMVRLLLRNATTDIPRLGHAFWDRVRSSRL